ncbi:MAG: iron ABC transporter permease [Candidatus Omnitrophota bacterium]|nr:iron ABC transporter permease [Candidatus Omnitrophota bacterium]
MSITPKRKILFSATILLVVILFSICKGSTAIPFLALFTKENQQILYLRLARIILGIFVGAGLGVCGVVLQAILRNPLAEPYLLGTSSGAGLGAVVAIMLGIGGAYLPFVAFAGALLSIILVYNLAREGSKIPVQSLILSGVIVAMALSGIILFLISISTNEALHGMMWWLLGSLQIFELKLIFVVATIVILGITLVFVLSQDLNAISIGEEEAIHLGIETETIKKLLFLITSLITGALVSVSGMIGFVGLIVPHMMRLIVGPNHKVLVPATCLAAAAFLVLCDTVSRSLLPPMEIPIGVITSLIGAPIFIILLKRRQGVK